MHTWRPRQKIRILAIGLAWRVGKLLAAEVYDDAGHLKGAKPATRSSLRPMSPCPLAHWTAKRSSISARMVGRTAWRAGSTWGP